MKWKDRTVSALTAATVANKGKDRTPRKIRIFAGVLSCVITAAAAIAVTTADRASAAISCGSPRGLFQTTDGSGRLGAVVDTNGTPADYTPWWYWDHIVPANFEGNSNTDLFFYRSNDGQAVFYTTGTTSSTGTASFHLEAAGNYALGAGWTNVVVGTFDGRAGNDVMLYNRSTGIARFYSITYSRDSVTGVGVVLPARLGADQYIGAGWDILVPGNFQLGLAGGLTDVLVYSQSGFAKFLAPTGSGAVTTMSSYNNWGHHWTQIVPGQFGGDAHTDLLFYDPSGGNFASQARGWFNIVVGGGVLTTAPGGPGDHRNWGNDWAKIVPGQFGGSAYTDLLFYRWPVQGSSNGRGLVQLTNGTGLLVNPTPNAADWDHTNWGVWDLIVPAQFAGSPYTDLLFYDNGVCLN